MVDAQGSRGCEVGQSLGNDAPRAEVWSFHHQKQPEELGPGGAGGFERRGECGAEVRGRKLSDRTDGVETGAGGKARSPHKRVLKWLIGTYKVMGPPPVATAIHDLARPVPPSPAYPSDASAGERPSTHGPGRRRRALAEAGGGSSLSRLSSPLDSQNALSPPPSDCAQSQRAGENILRPHGRISTATPHVEELGPGSAGRKQRTTGFRGNPPSRRQPRPPSPAPRPAVDADPWAENADFAGRPGPRADSARSGGQDEGKGRPGQRRMRPADRAIGPDPWPAGQGQAERRSWVGVSGEGCQARGQNGGPGSPGAGGGGLRRGSEADVVRVLRDGPRGLTAALSDR
jgi:hypothetical protein